MKKSLILVLIIIILLIGGFFIFKGKKETKMPEEKITMLEKAKGKKAVMIIAFRDFRDKEYFVPKEILEKAGIEVKTASNKKGTAIGADGGDTEVDLQKLFLFLLKSLLNFYLKVSTKLWLSFLLKPQLLLKLQEKYKLKLKLYLEK